MEKVKVFLSDSQVLFREGIHFILSGEDDFEVTGETTSNEEAFTLIEANPPSIAILSLQKGKPGDLEIIRRIKRSFASVSAILIIDDSDEESLFSAMKCGASACLTKDTDPEQLLEIIRTVIKGNLPLAEALLIPGIASKTLTEFKDLATLSEQLDNLLARLTPKETEILSAIAAGNGIEQVTAKLKINEEAARRSLRSILNKMVANDQAMALIEAAQRSLPSMIRSAVKMDGHPGNYVTKEEFNEFKDSLTERLKAFIGELA